MNHEEHIDPTAEISLETVKSRTIKGIVALTGRYFVLYLITIISQGFLGAFLTISQFGVFGVVSAIVNFLVYFSDIGLAASLIQKREKITDDDLKTTFTIQQILVLTLISVLFVFSKRISAFYLLDSNGLWLMYSLGISFFLSSLKTIPSVILERNLKFEVLAIANIFESIVYNVLLVFLAWKGFGITSFSIAVLARGVVGLCTLYFFQPWTPKLSISVNSLKHLLKFGIPYQINSFIAVLKDDGLTLILGKIIGLPALGILVWAQKWIQIPLRVVLDNVTRVTFPAFSRMQDSKLELEKAVTRSIFFSTILIFPMTAGIVFLAPVVFNIIPKYSQWLPAVIPLTLLAVNVLFAGVTTQLTNLLNAIGRIKVTSMLMVMWTVLTWVLVPYLGLKYGVNGASFGYSVVGLSSLIAIYVAKRYVNFSLTQSVVKPLLATFVMSMTLIALRNFIATDVKSLVALIVIGIISYTSAIFALVGASLLEDVKKVFTNFNWKR